jgi:hypothetical protein
MTCKEIMSLDQQNSNELEINVGKKRQTSEMFCARFYWSIEYGILPGPATRPSIFAAEGPGNAEIRFDH